MKVLKLVVWFEKFQCFTSSRGLMFGLSLIFMFCSVLVMDVVMFVLGVVVIGGRYYVTLLCVS